MDRYRKGGNVAKLQHETQITPATPMLQDVKVLSKQNEQHLQRSSTGYQNLQRMWDNLSQDQWVWEIAGIMLSLATLSSIISILLVYDQKPVPKLQSGLTLNAIISTLATVCRAALLFVTASILAQQKWLWFHNEPHPLQDTGLYDEASRGPLGAMGLLFSRCRSNIGALCALIAMLALAIEPFVQQSTTYPTRQTAADISKASGRFPATTSVTFELHSPNPEYYIDYQQPTVVIQQAIYEPYVLPVDVKCTGGTCDFERYDSLAFCAKCEDRRDHITQQLEADACVQAYNSLPSWDAILDLGNVSLRCNSSYSLGIGAAIDLNITYNATQRRNGEVLGISVEYPSAVLWNLHDQMPPVCHSANPRRKCVQWSNQTILDFEGPLLAYGFLNISQNSQTSRLEAVEANACVLTPCVHSYQRWVRNGTLTVNSTDTVADHGTIKYNETSNSGTGWSSVIGNQTFVIGDEDIDGLAGTLGDYIKGGFVTKLQTNLACSSREGTSNCSQAKGSTSSIQTIWHDFYNKDGSKPDNYFLMNEQFLTNVGGITEQIAAELTRMVQPAGGKEVLGLAYFPETYVNVTWQWLLLPSTLIVLGVVVLLTTIRQTRTRRLPVWKASQLPLVYASRIMADAEQLGNSPQTAHVDGFQDNRISSFDDRAHVTETRLVLNGQTWQLTRALGGKEALQKQQVAYNSGFRSQ